MMTIRQNYHSQNILAFYPYSLFIGFSITIIGIVIIKVIEHV
jgi:spore maturation protein A